MTRQSLNAVKERGAKTRSLLADLLFTN